MLEKHKQHDIEEIDAAISAKKERIQAEVQDLQSRSENVNQLIDDLNSYEDGYKLDNAIVIKLVTAKGYFRLSWTFSSLLTICIMYSVRLSISSFNDSPLAVTILITMALSSLYPSS
jgi:3-dehydroquinate dehydratase